MAAMVTNHLNCNCPPIVKVQKEDEPDQRQQLLFCRIVISVFVTEMRQRFLQLRAHTFSGCSRNGSAAHLSPLHHEIILLLLVSDL